jgi:hypothetical protein
MLQPRSGRVDSRFRIYDGLPHKHVVNAGCLIRRGRVVVERGDELMEV